mmetsp:Transcript_83851/g.242208  ORF Transcript_83851/g.242208 Transcript_83851/m.242208 type:complete len:132 (-) Transcript_83851:384-779(-)
MTEKGVRAASENRAPGNEETHRLREAMLPNAQAPDPASAARVAISVEAEIPSTVNKAEGFRAGITPVLGRCLTRGFLRPTLSNGAAHSTMQARTRSDGKLAAPYAGAAASSLVSAADGEAAGSSGAAASSL